MLLARDAVGDVICILTNKESFCDGTTPMTLAAKKNYYETLELLYQNGYRLETPVSFLSYCCKAISYIICCFSYLCVDNSIHIEI